MVIFRGTWFFELRFYFWVMRKHVSYFVWQIVWLQNNSFIKSVIFPLFLFLSSPSFWSHSLLSLVIQTQCMVGESWEKHVRDLERRNYSLNLFQWIDSYLAPSPFYPASEYWINQTAILEEETAFSVRWEEEREALKAIWKKIPLFLHCRCHCRCLSAVLKASELSPWIFSVPISLPKCGPCLVRRVTILVSCPPSGLNIFEWGVEQASFCCHFYSSHAMI